MAPIAFALAASLAIHLAGAALFAGEPVGKRTGSKEAGAKSADKKGGEEIVAMRARLAPEPPAQAERGKGALSAKDCPGGRHYTGIGLVFNLAGVIEMVAPGGPADRAGVRVGDVLAGSDTALLGPDKFKAGQAVSIWVMRGEERLPKPMRAAEICYETARRAKP